MGSRGAFIEINEEDFVFKEGEQHYKSLGTLKDDPNVKVIVQDSNNVVAPAFSHTKGRIYAIVKNGALKHLAYYDDQHKQAICIDFLHEHQGVKPHRHVYMNHEKGSSAPHPTTEEWALIKKIKKEYYLK